MWELNNMVLNNQWIKQIKREISKYLDMNENKTQHKVVGMQQKQC